MALIPLRRRNMHLDEVRVAPSWARRIDKPSSSINFASCRLRSAVNGVRP